MVRGDFSYNRLLKRMLQPNSAVGRRAFRFKPWALLRDVGLSSQGGWSERPSWL